MAKILPDPDSGHRYCESAFLRVTTCPMRRKRSMTVATIEHVAAGEHGERNSRTLILDEPMSAQEAMNLAQSYCDLYNVGVIYERHDEGDFTDTVTMPADRLAVG